jgi:hypothetical protein
MKKSISILKKYFLDFNPEIFAIKTTGGVMRRSTTLQEALYEMLHRSRINIDELADQMGVSKNYLYRSVIEGPSGCNFPIRLLVPAMKATKNYLPLKVINRDCGFLAIRPPRGNADRAVELSEYQLQFAKLLQVLISFFNDPSSVTLDHAVSALGEHMEQTACMEKKCMCNVNQMEFAL